MQSAFYCPNCSQLMMLMNIGDILWERDICLNPVALETNYQLHPQWPSDSYAMSNDSNELLEIQQEGVGMKSDQWSLLSEGISYEEISSDHNGDSYNSLDDPQQTTTCKQCCTLGSDEMVVPKFHNWPLSTDNSHTTVCRYCREEVKNCYYDQHLVKCVEHWKEEHGCALKRTQTYSHDQANKHYSSEETRHINDYNFTVNCTAIQETTFYSYF